MKNERYKLDTTITFNGRELDITLEGFYYPYQKATQTDPSKGDEMELIEVYTNYPARDIDDANISLLIEKDISWMFNDDELAKFNDILYANGERVE
jgi:hypothetical protein